MVYVYSQASTHYTFQVAAKNPVGEGIVAEVEGLTHTKPTAPPSLGVYA